MALKNDESISLLGKRLIDLMAEQKYESPRELAVHLYDQHLVHVKTRTTDNPDYDIRISAIGSIEKKIVRHIKTGLISDDTGEYLPAYCKTLKCSSDYLLGLTHVRSSNIEIRKISELTGLDETVIQNFIDHNNEETELVGRWWSFILQEPLFWDIPENLDYAEQKIEDQYHNESVLKALHWMIKHCPEDHKKDYYKLDGDIVEYEDRISSIQPTFQGLLYKISRQFTDAVEKHIIESKQKFKAEEEKEDLEHVQYLVSQGVHYYNFRNSESETTPIPDDIWEQLPQTYPDEGSTIAKKLMNDRLKTTREAFKANHPDYSPKPIDYEPDNDYSKLPEHLRKFFQEKFGNKQ